MTTTTACRDQDLRSHRQCLRAACDLHESGVCRLSCRECLRAERYAREARVQARLDSPVPSESERAGLEMAIDADARRRAAGRCRECGYDASSKLCVMSINGEGPHIV